MRLVITLFFIACSFCSFGQLFQRALPANSLSNVSIKDSLVPKKWYVSSFSSLQAGVVGFKGGSASYVAVPMGLQLNRTLTPSLYAFAGAAIVPSFISSHQLLMGHNAKGMMNGFGTGNGNRFQINPAAYIGLGYTNPEKSFEIQARLIMQRSDQYAHPAEFGNIMHSGFHGRPIVY